jgi:hypothetical protein
MSAPFSLSVKWMEPTAYMQSLPRLRAGKVPADQVLHVHLHSYVVALREVGGDASVGQRFLRHVLQMDQAVDPPRFFSINEFHPTSDKHSSEVETCPGHVDHHGSAWSRPEVPVLVRVARGWNADVIY